MNPKLPCVYLLTNRPQGVLYTGVTSDLPGRIWQHKQKLIAGFSHKYNANQLVWFECHEDMLAAIIREKQIKKWNRVWKIELIEASNPEWKDFYSEITGRNQASKDPRFRGDDGEVAESKEK